VGQGSSVSLVSGYGLDDRAIEDFSSSLCVQISSGAHPASCPMGTAGPFPGAKVRPRGDADTHPHLVPRSRMSRSYISSPPSAFMECSGTALALISRTEIYCTFYLICKQNYSISKTKILYACDGLTLWAIYMKARLNSL
jgi:hypothetical protein